MKVLSNLRAVLSGQTQGGRYLGYALGEVLLIVVGILIAIQLDNWNERRQERKLEQQYIRNLLMDVRDDFIGNDTWRDNFPAKITGLKTAKDYYYGDLAPPYDQRFFSSVGIGGVLSRGGILAATATYRDLISTGNIHFIKNEKIKDAIISYYLSKEFLDVYANNLRSGYADYVNGSLPYDPTGRLVADPRDMAVALKRYQRPEFLALINEELTFAYSVDNFLSRTMSQATALAELLEDYLTTF